MIGDRPAAAAICKVDTIEGLFVLPSTRDLIGAEIELVPLPRREYRLQKALATQGKPSADVDADLKASWSRSDTWTRTSRF